MAIFRPKVPWLLAGGSSIPWGPLLTGAHKSLSCSSLRATDPRKEQKQRGSNSKSQCTVFLWPNLRSGILVPLSFLLFIRDESSIQSRGGVTGSRSTRRQGSLGGSLEAAHPSAFPKQMHNPEMLVLYKNSTTLSFTAGTNNFIMNTRVYCYALGFLHVTVQQTQVQYLGQEDPLEEEMATYSSILGWEIPGT